MNCAVLFPNIDLTTVYLRQVRITMADSLEVRDVV